MFIWIHTSHPRPTSSMAEISRCWTEADSSGCFAGEASRSSCIGHREEGKKGQRKVKDWNERAWHKIRVLHIGIHCWSHRPMVCKPRAEVHPSHPATQLPKFDPLTKTLWKMHWTNHTIKMDYFEIGWSNKDFQWFQCANDPLLLMLQGCQCWKTCSHGLFRWRTMHYFIATWQLVNGNGETWPSTSEHYGALDQSRRLHPAGKGPLGQKECSQV